MGKFLQAFLLSVFLITSLSSCKPSHRERPYGDLRLGKVADFQEAEIVLDKERLLLRHDKAGFSVMSTLCSMDLTPLRRVVDPSGGEIRWVSDYSASVYQNDGKVIHGPAVRNLPYFKIVLDQGNFDSPKDTLYARIGEEVPPTWRLPP